MLSNMVSLILPASYLKYFKTFQFKYTLGEQDFSDAHNQFVIQSSLTRNLGVLFADVRDEIVVAFEDALSLQGKPGGTLSI